MGYMGYIREECQDTVILGPNDGELNGTVRNKMEPGQVFIPAFWKPQPPYVIILREL